MLKWLIVYDYVYKNVIREAGLSMKKWARVLFLVLLVLLVLTGMSSIRLISSISSYSTLINYVGIVRGASQRLVKLELNQQSDGELEQYVDEILVELMSGEGQYGLKRPEDPEYNKCLEKLSGQWNVVKEDVEQMHQGKGAERLLEDSEILFAIANDTVFAIENYSRSQSDILSKALMGNVAGCLVAGVSVILSVLRQYVSLKKESEELAYRANRDSLTETYEYKRFLELAEEALTRDSLPQNAMAQNEGIKLAFQRLDFVNFKYINDVFGYSYGDSILCRYARCLMDTLRDGEYVGRIVADQFVVLRYYRDKDELIKLQEQVDRAFFATEQLLPERYAIVIASGFCCLEDVVEKLDAQALINRATYAQKTIKSNPTRHYAFYNEAIREKMIEENRIKSRVEMALEKREFVVYYQPKVSPEDGQVRGAEALVRWRLPDGRILAPGMFVPILERNQMIKELDQYVFGEVCRQMGERIRAGKPIVPVSVNVSKLRLYTLDFVETYAKFKEENNIPDGYLEIEFTETVAFENLNYMMKIMQDMHEKGFLCSMDDFGKGYSSLGMLKSLPIDTVKLDASFFQEGGDQEKQNVIITSVLTLIRQLRMKVVAEGIEEPEQVEFLKNVGCDYIQGYYYYRPMPEAEFEEMLEMQEIA